MDESNTEIDATVDAERAFEQFRRETGSEDRISFAAWLSERGDLAGATLVDLHSREPIRTSIEALETLDTDDLETFGTVGRGGAGEVFIARDPRLGRKVAVKVMTAKDPRRRERALRRFVHEAQITAQLEHPHIVPVYRLRELPGGEVAYSMKLVRGRTLTQLIETDRTRCYERGAAYERQARAQRLEHFLKICDAMGYAHDKGVLHRDLKPDNVMLGPFNEVYVMDWGIAKVLANPRDEPAENAEPVEVDEAGLTRTGQLLGTPRYMSPEQGAGHVGDLDARSDVAALGVMLYELVTLRRARDTSDFADLLKMVKKATVGPMQHSVGAIAVPPELPAIIRKATRRDPDARYATAGDLAADVRAFLRDEPVSARPDGPVHRLLRWVSRHRAWALGLLTAMAVMLVAVTMTSLVRQRRAAQQALAREHRLEQLLSEVASSTSAIDAALFGVEERLSRFVTATAELIQHGEPVQDVPVYLATDFADPTTRPPGLLTSPRYRADVTLRHVDFALPVGASREAWEERMRRLIPLRHVLRRIILSSRALGASTRGLSEEEAERVAIERGLPVDRAYFGSVEGMNVEMPGQLWETEGFDPRVRPWYRLGEEKRGFEWGNPFVEIATESLLISCSTGVWAEDGRFLGTAGLGIAVRFLVEELMAVDEPAVRETFLVDDTGRVVVSRREASRKVALGEDLSVVEGLVPYPHLDALAPIARDRSGTARVTTPAGERLLVVQPLASTGWRYVVEVDVAALFGT